MALFVGQLPFIWAMAFLFASIASWRRHRRWLGTALLVLAMTTHAAVVAPMALLLIAGYLLVTPERSTLAIHTLVAATLSLPAAYLVATSPAVEQTTIRFRIEQFFRVLATRGTVLLVPLVLLGIVRLARTASFRALIQRSLAGVFVLLAGLNAALLNTMNSYAWRAPWRAPDEVIKTFIDSPEYMPGAVYRVLGYSDGRVSMLRLIQTGARLDGEFFPESQARRSWPSIVAYEQTLIDRRVDVVIAWHTYDTRWHTNEHARSESTL